MHRAIAPYSNFKVGAALRTKAGKIYTGHNIESSSYSLTVCAERVAMFKALSEGERVFDSIAIVASSGDLCPPCGACRQVLSDFAENLTVVLSDAHGHHETHSLSNLLPLSFSGKNLKTENSNADAKREGRVKAGKAKG
ncbi:MAG: cytidine deaminase [Rhizobacter sp.]|nr:cytidine deaminase [Chlorobiales bacterium]